MKEKLKKDLVWKKSKTFLIGVAASITAIIIVSLVTTALKAVVEVIDNMVTNIPYSVIAFVVAWFCAIFFFIMWIRQRWIERLSEKEEESHIFKSKSEEEKKQLKIELEEKTQQYDALIKECRKEEEVSKVQFDEFEAITLSFENILNTNKNPLVKLFNESYAKIPELLSYNNRLKDYISRSYNNYIKRLKKFDGTKECFELLVDEFENVFFAYEALFVKPIEKRKDEIVRDKNLKRKFNEFADGYGAMRRQYIDYGKKMNKMYGTNIIRTDFDYVDKV